MAVAPVFFFFFSSEQTSSCMYHFLVETFIGLRCTQRSRVRVLALARNFWSICKSGPLFQIFSALCDFSIFLPSKGPVPPSRPTVVSNISVFLSIKNDKLYGPYQPGIKKALKSNWYCIKVEAVRFQRSHNTLLQSLH